MTIIQAIILGIVQGLTEYLPVSSSAHLVFIPFLMHWSIEADQMFVFNVLVQLGTLIAVIVYFRKNLWMILRDFFKGIFSGKPFHGQESKMGWYLILATIPAGVFGLALKNQVEQVFASPTFSAVFLIVTAVLLLIGEKISTHRRTLKSLGWLDALIIGLFQAVSIFPGISRSGATISGGLMRKFDRQSSARFSFLMSIPIMLAAGLLGVLDLFDIPNLKTFLPKMVIGFLIAGVVGYFVIHFFMKLVSRISLLGFAIYCALVGLIMLAVSLFLFPSPAAPVASAPENLTTIHVQAPPSLAGYSSKINLCAQQHGELKVDYSGSSEEEPDSGGRLVLSLKQIDPSMNVYQVGSEDLIFIMNNDNGASQLTSNELFQIYLGTTVRWKDADLPIEVYTYPTETDIQQLFISSVMNNGPVTTLSHLVFTPQEMVAAVASDHSAIGMIPASLIDSSVKTVQITDLPASLMDIPVLAGSVGEPSAASILLIKCLQQLP